MRPYVLMLFGAFAFAIMGAFAHAAGKYCSWQVIALARSVIALSIVTTLALKDRDKLVFIRPWSLWVRSLAGSMSILCNFYALSHLPIADALTLTNMFPVWIAVLSWPVLGKPPEAEVWLALLLALFGVVLMQEAHLLHGSIGTLAAVTGSVTSAIALIGLHRLKRVAPNAVVAHFSTVSILVVLFSTLIWPLEKSIASQVFASPKAFGLLIGTGIAATAGQMLLTRAFASGAPTRVSVVQLTQVLFAMIFDIVIWHRSFGAKSIAGMLLVIGPTVWLMLRRPASSSNEPRESDDAIESSN
ncbi:MAG: DMT family transporter [Planctomycetota bacterium]